MYESIDRLNEIITKYEGITTAIGWVAAFIGFCVLYVKVRPIPSIFQKTVIKNKLVFVSAPISSVPVEERKALQEVVEHLCKFYRDELSAKVFSSYLKFFDPSNPNKFINPRPAFVTKEVFKHLKESKAFVLVYPKAAPTGSFVELGLAMALGKKCIIIYHKDVELPWCLRESAPLQSANYDVTLFPYNDYKSLFEQIRGWGNDLFKSGLL